MAIASVAPIPGYTASQLPKECIQATRSLLPGGVDAGYLIQRLLLHIPARKLLREAGARLVWIDTDLYKPLLREGTRIIEYIHFPYEVLDPAYRRLLPPGEARIVDEYLSRYRRGIAKLYLRAYTLPASRLRRPIPFPGNVVPVANSRYIALLVEAIHGVRPTVLYPPVDPGRLAAMRPPGFKERGRIVASIGRISPEKRYETLIEAASLARSRPRVVIAGSAPPAARDYIARLRSLASRLGVDLDILENPTVDRIAEVGSTSRVYVHTTVGEHFGITVVEAMAMGLPVIVHKSGGPWMDIVEEGRYGLGFTGPGDLAESIDRLLGDPREWEALHRASLERFKVFSFERFTSSLRSLIEKSG